MSGCRASGRVELVMYLIMPRLGSARLPNHTATEPNLFCLARRVERRHHGTQSVTPLRILPLPFTNPSAYLSFTNPIGLYEESDTPSHYLICHGCHSIFSVQRERRPCYATLLVLHYDMLRDSVAPRGAWRLPVAAVIYMAMWVRRLRAVGLSSNASAAGTCQTVL